MKHRVLVLGGCGFIGRNFVSYLLDNDLVDHIRVVDKVPPEIAWLNKKHLTAFQDERVEFKSANLINPDFCKNAFKSEENFDYVVNFAAETRAGQSEAVYKEGVLKLSLNCANESALMGVKRYVELSSGNMLSSEKTPITETCKKDPWTQVAKWKLQVEENLSNIPNLNYTIVRPAIIYGLGDKQGLTPRLVIGSIYKFLGESMKLLWTKDLKMNTIHVVDVCRAIVHLMTRDDTNRQCYNLVDESDTTQGYISCLVSELFNINHDYWGMAVSMLAKTNLLSVLEEVNDKHMSPWAEICAHDNIENTPLSPYIDRELLAHKHINLDGQKLKSTGFVHEYPRLTLDSLREVIEDYVNMNIFPASLIS